MYTVSEVCRFGFLYSLNIVGTGWFKFSGLLRQMLQSAEVIFIQYNILISLLILTQSNVRKKFTNVTYIAGKIITADNKFILL